jgi:hypothetical protein
LILALLLNLALVGGPSVSQEEIGAKAIFENPLLGMLFVSPQPNEWQPPGKGKKKPARQHAQVPKQPNRPPVTPPRLPGDLGGGASSSPEAKPALGIRFWVQEVDHEGKVIAEVRIGQIFHSRQRIQVVVESNTDGYLAVVQEGSDGRAGLLYPVQEADLLTVRIPAHAKVILPNRNQYFLFDERAGTERLLIVLARDRQELADLALRREMGAADLARIRSLAAREIGAKNLVVESFSVPGGDQRSYAVNVNGGAIVQEIALLHER